MPAISQITAIANMSAMGLSQRDIGRKLNMHHSKVQRVLKDEQCRSILDTTIRIYIAHAKAITRRFLKLCYHDDPKISLDAIKHYNQVTGIAPSHTQSVVINQIFAQVNVGSLTPAALDYVRYLKAGMSNESGTGAGQDTSNNDDVIDIVNDNSIVQDEAI